MKCRAKAAISDPLMVAEKGRRAARRVALQVAAVAC
jgi:hypothetical protein